MKDYRSVAFLPPTAVSTVSKSTQADLTMNAVFSYLCVFFFFLNVCQLPHCTILRQKKKKKCASFADAASGTELWRRGRRRALPVAGVTRGKSRGRLCRPIPAFLLGRPIGSPSIPEACGRALCGDADPREMALGNNRVPSPPPRRLGESEIPYIRDMSGSMF